MEFRRRSRGTGAAHSSHAADFCSAARAASASARWDVEELVARPDSGRDYPVPVGDIISLRRAASFRYGPDIDVLTHRFTRPEPADALEKDIPRRSVNIFGRIGGIAEPIGGFQHKVIVGAGQQHGSN